MAAVTAITRLNTRKFFILWASRKKFHEEETYLCQFVTPIPKFVIHWKLGWLDASKNKKVCGGRSCHFRSMHFGWNVGVCSKRRETLNNNTRLTVLVWSFVYRVSMLHPGGHASEAPPHPWPWSKGTPLRKESHSRSLQTDHSSRYDAVVGILPHVKTCQRSRTICRFPFPLAFSRISSKHA